MDPSTLITSEYQVHAAIKVFALIATLVSINICTGIFSSSYISRSVLSSDEPIPLMMLVPTILCIDALIMVAGTLAIAYARVPRQPTPSEGKSGAYTEAVISAGRIVAMDAVPVLLVKGLLYATIAYNLGSSDYFDYRTNGLDLIKSFRRQVIVIGMVVACLPFAIAGAAILRMFTSDKSSNTQTLEELKTEYEEYVDNELIHIALRGVLPTDATNSAAVERVRGIVDMAASRTSGGSSTVNVSKIREEASAIDSQLKTISSTSTDIGTSNPALKLFTNSITEAVEKVRAITVKITNLAADPKQTTSGASVGDKSLTTMVLSLLKDVVFMPNSETLKKKWRDIARPMRG